MSDEKQKPIVSKNDIQVKKKSKAESIMAGFVSDLVINVFFPAIERTLGSIVSDTFDVTKRTILSAMKFDDSINSSTRKTNGGPTHISYDAYYERAKAGGVGAFTPRVNDHPYNEVTFTTRPKAELVLARLVDICRRNKYVTVGHYYDLCDIPTSETDFYFGWTSLDNVQIITYADGYRIKLPRALPIDR